MPSPSHPVELFSFSTSLFGMLVLTLGMGLGRFLYTPMLPVMMAEGSFSFSQLSWIASGNYAGYLAGSLLFSFGAFHQPSRLRTFLLASALASGLLILAMAWLPPFILVLLIRVLAGVARTRINNTRINGGNHAMARINNPLARAEANRNVRRREGW